jgi:hypothetical protein
MKLSLILILPIIWHIYTFLPFSWHQDFRVGELSCWFLVGNMSHGTGICKNITPSISYQLHLYSKLPIYLAYMWIVFTVRIKKYTTPIQNKYMFSLASWNWVFIGDTRIDRQNILNTYTATGFHSNDICIMEGNMVMHVAVKWLICSWRWRVSHVLARCMYKINW